MAFYANDPLSGIVFHYKRRRWSFFFNTGTRWKISCCYLVLVSMNY